MAFTKISVFLVLAFVLVLSACNGPVPTITGAGNETQNGTIQPGASQNGTPAPLPGGGVPAESAARFLGITGVTTPHVADAQDACTVTVSVSDANGSPVTGAAVRVVLSGDDYLDVFNATEIGGGEYSASVSSPYAGLFSVQAKDDRGTPSEPVTVEFTAGPVSDLRMTFSNPRLSTTGDESAVRVWAIDKFGNIVPNASIQFSTSAGTMTVPVKDKDGRYSATLSWKSLGTAVVNASSTVQANFVEKAVGKGGSITLGNYTATVRAIGTTSTQTPSVVVEVTDGRDNTTAVIDKGRTALFFDRALTVEFVRLAYEPDIGDVARLKMTAGESRLISASANISFPLFFIDAGKYAVVGEEYPATLYLYVPDNKLVSYYALTLNYNPQALQADNQSIVVPNEVWKSYYYPGSGHILFYKSFNSSNRPPKQILEIGKVNFAVTGTGTIGLEAWLFDNDSNNFMDTNETKIVPEYTNTVSVSGTGGGFAWAGTAVLKNSKPVCVKAWDVNNSVTEQEFRDNDFARLKELFKKLVPKSCPRFNFSYKWNTLGSDDWQNISGGDNDLDIDTWPDLERLYAHREAGCINVYYVPKIGDPNTTGVTTSPRLNPDPASQGIALDKQRRANNTLAHEVGHFLGLSHDEYEKNASGTIIEKTVVKPDGNKTSLEVSNNTNLMYPYKEITKFDLDELQCAEITSRNP